LDDRTSIRGPERQSNGNDCIETHFEAMAVRNRKLCWFFSESAHRLKQRPDRFGALLG